MKQIILQLSDLFMFPLYLFIIYQIMNKYEERLTTRTTVNVYYKAFTAKTLMTLAYMAIYQFYYGVGDTISYYKHASRLLYIMIKDTNSWVEFITYMPHSGLPYPKDLYKYFSGYHLISGKDEWFVCKIAFVINTLAFDSFMATSLVFSFYAFIGMWKMYQSFVGLYPHLYKYFAVACFFIPSALFWSGGISKDSITYGSLGIMTYAVLNIIIYKRKIKLSIMLIIITGYLIFQIKIYILLGFLPALMFWYYSTFKASIKHALIRYLSIPFILLVSGGGGYYLVSEIAGASDKYNSWEAIEKRVYGFYDDHTTRQNTSAYSFGDFDFSPVGIVKKIPAAINVALFRPYFWEVRNPVMLISALESFLFLFITIIIFLRSGIINTFKMIFGNAEMQLCLIFTLIFGFAVGFTAYNFGALVRFKIPMLPFFGIGLSLLWYKHKKDKAIIR